MDVSRAQAIMEAVEKVDVTLNGRKVWIDSVDSTTQMATVHEEERHPIESETVRVQELHEIQ